MTAIPKRLGHIWIGPKPAPLAWMQTWPEKHPDWEYTVYDNDFLAGFPFRLRRHIDEYFWRGLYAGVQDMMRYEILYHFGGFMADADAICLHPVDELLDKPRVYTVYDRPEGDKFRGVCPFLASDPGNAFLGQVIDAIADTDPAALRKAEVSTGNRFLRGMIRDLAPDEDTLKIFPVHYFVPWQKSDPTAYYDGPDKVYAEQKWATSTYAYNKADGPGEEVLDADALDANRQQMLDRLAGGVGQRLSPLRHLDNPRKFAVAEIEAQVDATLQDDACRADMADLNRAIIASLKTAGRDDQPVHGLHFYRHMQNADLVDSKLRTRSDRIRARLAGWLAQADDALIVGFDSGHLPLLAMHLNADLRLTAVESGRWRRDKDKTPPAPHIYAPAAADWLTARFGDRLAAHIGLETDVLSDLAQDRANHGRFDLLMMPASDIVSLAILKAALPLLRDDAVVVCASAEQLTGATQAQRFMMQDLAFVPLEREDYGRANGSLSVFRPRLGR